jgi:hypothetical protein
MRDRWNQRKKAGLLRQQKTWPRPRRRDIARYVKRPPAKRVEQRRQENASASPRLPPLIPYAGHSLHPKSRRLHQRFASSILRTQIRNGLTGRQKKMARVEDLSAWATIEAGYYSALSASC